ncbi:MAG TPA: amylo-alpha-1,6-glucosidase [Nitrospira sp.]|nr:amylo-alpha-1,6-glucosidase [Nitrospira sp.]
MRISKEDCRNLDRALALEWLEPNGRGGFASGTVAGANTRRYHALLLTARQPPGERIVLVNHVEEWVDVGGESFSLSTNVYPGAVHPAGYERCDGFSTEPWPTWTFDCNGTSVRREILSILGRDIVIIRWKVPGNAEAAIRVRPMLTGRDYHATHHENDRLLTGAMSGDGVVSWQTYPDLPTVTAFHSGVYRHAPDWYRRVEFSIEGQRGLDHEEDWWSPGELSFVLPSNSEPVLVLTSESVERLDIAGLIAEEEARRAAFRDGDRSGDPLAGPLRQAASAFLVQRGTDQTVIAGYPWFTDWGRDAFISLPGLCLATGRTNSAWHVIAAFASSLSEGMVPNRFPDAGDAPEYNSIDASLWFVYAVDRYLAASHDEPKVRDMAWPAIKDVLDGYRVGTRYGIRMDHDGLIAGGTPGVPLTWMDGKIGDRGVTPRQGKPVEIQALWVRALIAGENLARQFGERNYADRCRRDRQRAVASFRKRFWYEEGGYLYDVIDGPEGDDASFRPNQLYAISLVDDLVPRKRAQQILRLVESTLLTPVGLRTLSPQDGRYRPRYEGAVPERDSAYHQGSVWPFLLGPFITAWVKHFGRNAKVRAQARTFLAGLEAHLHDACLGQVSEIFDGEPPHHPRGCFAQAWSVAEPLRTLAEDLGVELGVPPPMKTVLIPQTSRVKSTKKRLGPSTGTRPKRNVRKTVRRAASRRERHGISSPYPPCRVSIVGSTMGHSHLAGENCARRTSMHRWGALGILGASIMALASQAAADCPDGSRTVSEAEQQAYLSLQLAIKAAIPPPPAGWSLKDPAGKMPPAAPKDICKGADPVPGWYGTYSWDDEFKRTAARDRERDARIRKASTWTPEEEKELDEYEAKARDLERKAVAVIRTNPDEAARLRGDARPFSEKANALRKAHNERIAPEVESIRKEYNALYVNPTVAVSIVVSEHNGEADAKEPLHIPGTMTAFIEVRTKSISASDRLPLPTKAAGSAPSLERSGRRSTEPASRRRSSPGCWAPRISPR